MASAGPVRLGVIGIGNRGTALLRSAAGADRGRRSSRSATPSPSTGCAGRGSSRRRSGHRPEAFDDPRQVLDRKDVDAVVVALPCDLHEPIYRDAIAAGKHLYAEKPLAPTLAGLRPPDRRAGQGAGPGRPRRVPAAVEPALSRGSRADPPGRAGAAGRGARRLDQQQRPDDRPRRLAGPPRPVGRLDGRAGRPRLGRPRLDQGRAAGPGQRLGPPRPLRRDRPDRDVTDHYSVELEWADGFRASFVQSWIAPADEGFTGSTLRVLGEEGGFDFSTGVAHLSATDRCPARRSTPGPQADTRTGARSVPRLDPVRFHDPATHQPGRGPRGHANRSAGRKAVDERRIVTIEEVRAHDRITGA